MGRRKILKSIHVRHASPSRGEYPTRYVICAIARIRVCPYAGLHFEVASWREPEIGLIVDFYWPIPRFLSKREIQITSTPSSWAPIPDLIFFTKNTRKSQMKNLKGKNIENQLCVVVGTASHQQRLRHVLCMDYLVVRAEWRHQSSYIWLFLLRACFQGTRVLSYVSWRHFFALCNSSLEDIAHGHTDGWTEKKSITRHLAYSSLRNHDLKLNWDSRGNSH